MKTIKQIIEKIKNDGFESDFLSFLQVGLIYALPFESAKEFLIEEYQNDAEIEKNWNYLKTDKDVLKAIADYVDFTQEKIDNERGRSAERSCQYFIACFWLIDEQFSRELETTYKTNYNPYGQPLLDKVKQYLANKEVSKKTMTNREYLNTLDDMHYAIAVLGKVSELQAKNTDYEADIWEIVNDTQMGFEDWLAKEYEEKNNDNND